MAILSDGWGVSRSCLPSIRVAPSIAAVRIEQPRLRYDDFGHLPSRATAIRRNGSLVSISIGYERELGEWTDPTERCLNPVVMRLFELCIDFV